MLGRKILSVGRVLLICSLAHCHHLSHSDEDYLNRQAWRVASGREQGSAGQRILQDRYSDKDEQSNGNDDVAGHIPGGHDSDRNEVDPKDLRKFVEQLRKDYSRWHGEDKEEDQSTEDTRSLGSRYEAIHRRKEYSQRRGDHPIDSLSQLFDSGEPRDDEPTVIDGDRLKRMDRVEEESKSNEERTPSVRSDERRSDEEAEEEDGRPSKSENQESRYEGYEKYEGVGIYKFHREGADSFDEASEICKLEGGHLAIANSKDEADVFVTLWIRHGPGEESDAYVGIHRRNQENVFRTVFGNSLASTGYMAWRADEPDNHNGAEHCVSFYRYGGYRDIPCNGPHPFICELRWKDEN